MSPTNPSPRRAAGEDLVVFLGPSLSAGEARRLAPCTVLPPARQGDLWRALTLQPRAVALVDGVFGSQPSVWHREILSALDSGVAVFGAASMGALRAAELWREGMVGVGRIFGWYRDGVIEDDSEVALLHAGPEHGFEPFTVPLVNVRHAAERARAENVLGAREAAALVDAGRRTFYQERTWPQVVRSAERRWSAGARRRWASWAANGLGDLKRLDAIACIEAAAELVRRTGAGAAAPARGSPRIPSSLVRRRQLQDGVSRVPGARPIENAQVLEALESRPDASALQARGLRRALLAGWARELGLAASADELAREEREWLRRCGFTPRRRREALAAAGLGEAELRALLGQAALGRRLLELAPRMVADGPSSFEALAEEARLSGLWSALARRAARRGGRSR